MDGAGTADSDLIHNLLLPPAGLVSQIAHEYQTKYGKDLVKTIQKEVSGNFEKILVMHIATCMRP